MVLRDGHGELWADDASTSDGFDDLAFVAVFDLVFGVLFIFVLFVLVVQVLVVLLLVELSLLLRLLMLLLGLVAVEVLSAYVLALILWRSLLFFLGLLLLLSLLFLLRGFLHAALETVDPAGELVLLGFVDLELEDLFVGLGHPEVPAFHLVGQQGRQVVEEAVGVVEDLDVVRVELGPGLDVPVVLGEDLVLGVEAVQQPQEPLLVRLLLLDLLYQGLDRLERFHVPVTLAVEVLCGLLDVSQDHLVGGRVGNHPASVDVLCLGHEDSTYPDLVHELDGDDALLEGWHDVAHLQHGVVEVLLAPDELAQLLSGDVLLS